MNRYEVIDGYALELCVMKSSSNWRLLPNFDSLNELFGDLDNIFRLKGKRITSDRLSDVILVEHSGTRYYVKRYYVAGKGLRRYFGKPRIQNEWENLLWFAQHGIPTARIVAYGMESRFGLFKRGALITEEIPDTQDLAEIARKNDDRLSDDQWVEHVSLQVADAMRVMHRHNFIHNDFKWRNLLVDNKNNLYLIDCPLGAFWQGALFRHRVIKEFATLDRVARYKLSRSQRLRFYLQYVQKSKLDDDDKSFLRKLAQRKERRVSSFARE